MWRAGQVGYLTNYETNQESTAEYSYKCPDSFIQTLRGISKSSKAHNAISQRTLEGEKGYHSRRLKVMLFSHVLHDLDQLPVAVLVEPDDHILVLFPVFCHAGDDGIG